ncbi:MAG: hypothetical protein JSS54_02435 [Proteobacteria bacterium]|nr:hypothetical protein [Pseudomonadota bacterium]
MPDFVLRIEANAADKDMLTAMADSAKTFSDLGLYLNGRADVAANARILAERGRTIDQIKRLYAVVMGFALTQLVQNLVAMDKVLSGDWNARLTYFAVFVSFVSPLSLIYLGSERMLDTKYLDPGEKQPPDWKGLTVDLFMLGFTATIFVILAETFANQTSLSDALSEFLFVLAILYALDVIFLAIQYLFVLPAGSPLLRPHLKWLIINLISVALAITLWYWGAGIGELTCSLILTAANTARFFWDFSGAFKHYYPSESLK